jgi:hypothetical protein
LVAHPRFRARQMSTSAGKAVSGVTLSAVEGSPRTPTPSALLLALAERFESAFKVGVMKPAEDVHCTLGVRQSI